MENTRRFILAIALTVLVVIATQYLFPPPKQPASATPTPPTATTTTPAAAAPNAPAVGATAPGAATIGAATADSTKPAPPVVPAETVLVAGTRAAYTVASQGGALVAGEMRAFRDLHTGAPSVQLAPRGEALLRYRLVVPGDTLDLSRTAFRVARNGNVVRLDGTASGRATAAVPVSIVYSFVPDSYTVHVTATATGVAGPTFLLVDLPQTLRVSERDSLEHFSHLAYAWKPRTAGASSIAFAKLDPGERELVPGPLAWSVAKSKYFLVGVLAPASGPGFSELTTSGGVRATKVATRAQATVVAPLANGGVAFDVYAGPQEWRRLSAMGRDFENANPYGGWLQGIVQPFATIVIRVLLWMRDVLKLSYGWVLIIFGVAVRMLLWPLQQNSMRSQIKMQRVQPELQLLQTKYKNDPQKLQSEMMRVYAEHGMSPFSALTGCLPMLIPLPIFFALFYVFQNTIEFRGVPFLWLHDISVKDPFYILPVFVAATAMALSWIGMRNSPPNPQAKMMMYALPAMMLFFFINVASGLNLYYAVQNLVALPQQWLLSHERTKAAAGPVVQGTPVKRKA